MEVRRLDAMPAGREAGEDNAGVSEAMFDHVEAFYEPKSIPEAVRLLRRGAGRTRVVAGGTDIAVQADRSIRFLIDIRRLGLDYIRRKGSGWVIGATTTMTALEECPAIQILANGILSRAASTCGSVQIRNMATLGGNLANASPAAETAPPLLVLDARVILAGTRGRRRVPLREFFSGPGKTILNGALLVEIEIPPVPRGGRTGWSFQKVGRIESDIAVVNASAVLQVDRARRCTWARIALGAVAPTPMRARKTEEMLLGQAVDAGLLDRVSEAVVSEVHPITDVRASAEYRREMSRVLVQRALRECAEHAGCPL